MSWLFLSPPLPPTLFLSLSAFTSPSLSVPLFFLFLPLPPSLLPLLTLTLPTVCSAACLNPGEFICSAQRDGDQWVISGEKWFTSNGANADFLIVMAITNPDAPLTERASMFLVDRDTPGVEIVRNVHTIGTSLQENYNTSGGGGHAYIRYNDVRIPRENLLGEEGAGFVGSQTRLSGGRVHHAMRTVGAVRRLLDMMAERAASRTTKGSLLADEQGVQEMIGRTWLDLQQFRLLVLHAAWAADQPGGSPART